MKVTILGSTCAAAMLAATVVAAQNPSPTQAPTQGNPQQRPAERNDPGAPRIETDKQVTLVGCVAREGASDIILTGAAVTPAGTSGNGAGGVTGSTSTAPVGTSGAATAGATAATGPATASKYRLSGERDLDQFIGQRVEIVGRMDPGEAAKAPGAPNASTGSAPASESASDGKSSTADTSSKASAPTPHVTITSVRAMGGNCL
jgi:hypothetical protein